MKISVETKVIESKLRQIKKHDFNKLEKQTCMLLIAYTNLLMNEIILLDLLSAACFIDDDLEEIIEKC